MAEVEEPDAGLEIREGFAGKLRGALKTAAQDGTTRSADQVARRLGLSW